VTVASAVHISPALCQRCGACCSALVDGELVACRHLRTTSSGYACAIYTTRPAVCRDYDCMRADQPDPAVADRVAAALQSIESANQPAAATTAA